MNDDPEDDNNEEEAANDESRRPRVDPATLSPLRNLHDTAASIEKARISVGNRIDALKRGVDGAVRPVPEIYEEVMDMLVAVEHRIDEGIIEELRPYAVWNTWLSHVRGVGPSLGGQLLALLLPPLADRGPSTWYKAAGLVAELQPDGLMRLPRPRKDGGKITYHPRLRRDLWNLAKSFVMVGGYYRTIYDQNKARLTEKHRDEPEIWPPHRIEAASRWATVKLFLSHLYSEWLIADGLSSGDEERRSYVVDVLGHHYIPAPKWDGKRKI